MPASKNRYFFLRRGQEPLEVDIFDETANFGPDVCLTYWLRVFRCFDRISHLDAQTVYIVWNTDPVHELPSYGKDVIVLLLMDEFCFLPPYLGRIQFAFKTHGFSLYHEGMLREKTPAALIKLVRDESLWLWNFASFAVRNRGSLFSTRRMVVPLGYGRQPEVPIKPFAERNYTISFVGSIDQRSYHPLSVRALIKTPKSIARSRMARSLRKIADGIPGQVHFAATTSFLDSITSDGLDYARVIADSKICLAPRGSSVETFRLFEAMRQGCVVICDRQPRHWFYRNCPIVEIGDWANLDAVLKPLLADHKHLMDLHRRSLNWWQTVASESAVAKAMATRLQHSDLTLPECA